MQPTCQQQQLQHANVSIRAQNCPHLRFDPFKINIFFFDQQKKQIKTKLSAKYNHLIIHIQLVKCQHFYQQYITCAAK